MANASYGHHVSIPQTLLQLIRQYHQKYNTTILESLLFNSLYIVAHNNRREMFTPSESAFSNEVQQLGNSNELKGITKYWKPF